MAGRKPSRALFYSRDSGGKHDQTPAQYVGWAQRKATELGLHFDGTPALIGQIIECGQPNAGDLYFDSCVPGNQLSRPALDALRARVDSDADVSHLFIPRRDRLARPDDPVDGLKLETSFRRSGLTLVYMDKVLQPLSRGQRLNPAENIVSMFEFDQSGRFRRELGEKMVFTQLELAQNGFSIGGRPPFGYRRWLVSVDGTKVRELADSERVRMHGHHVVWLRGPTEEVELIRRILAMLKTMPACRVAATLTSEGIPSPNANRIRTDRGVPHRVSGIWHQTTIINIARHPLLVGQMEYGRRSMGDQVRFTPDGPRDLVDSDFRSDDKCKVIRNDEHVTVRSNAACQPLVDIDEHTELLAELDRRAGSQRGKPRSREPGRNPLGSRIHDMECTWPMYRVALKNGRFLYVCGLYQQSHAKLCRHNHVDGMQAVRFTMSAIMQRILQPSMLQKVRAKLLEKSRAESTDKGGAAVLSRLKAQHAKVAAEIDVVTNNLARAESEDKYRAISKVFDDLTNESRLLEAEIQRVQRSERPKSAEQNRAEATALIDQLVTLAEQDENQPAIGDLIAKVNAQLFLRFVPVQKKKRIENHVSAGVLTFGAAALPITKYNGPTSRKKLASSEAEDTVAGVIPATGPVFPGGIDESSGNVNRGDRI